MHSVTAKVVIAALVVAGGHAPTHHKTASYVVAGTCATNGQLGNNTTYNQQGWYTVHYTDGSHDRHQHVWPARFTQGTQRLTIKGAPAYPGALTVAWTWTMTQCHGVTTPRPAPKPVVPNYIGNGGCEMHFSTGAPGSHNYYTFNYIIHYTNGTFVAKVLLETETWVDRKPDGTVRLSIAGIAAYPGALTTSWFAAGGYCAG